MSEVFVKHPAEYEIDIDTLQAFERGLEPHKPEQSTIPARVLGYGEISTVFEIQVEGMQALAFKRLPIFYTQNEMAIYRVSFDEYNRLLEEEVGLRLPPHGYAAFPADSGRPIFYIIQQQEADSAVGHKAIHLLDEQNIVTLFTRLLRELRKVWDFNRQQAEFEIGLDGQISNWVIVGFDEEQRSLDDKSDFLYLDTSTPLFRIKGEEQLNPELFLRSAPSFLRWVLRWLFLEDVVTRYYDLHLVVVDIIAQFYKEQRPELIPNLVTAANEFFAGEGAELDVAPFTEKEIEAYYKEDALIWSLYLNMRRIDRFLHRMLRRDYPYILPGQIKR